MSSFASLSSTTASSTVMPELLRLLLGWEVLASLTAVMYLSIRVVSVVGLSGWGASHGSG